MSLLRLRFFLYILLHNTEGGVFIPCKYSIPLKKQKLLEFYQVLPENSTVTLTNRKRIGDLIVLLGQFCLRQKTKGKKNGSLNLNSFLLVILS